MLPTIDTLKAISKTKPTSATEANMNSIVVSLKAYGEKFELDMPHRLAHFLAQSAHESGSWKYDKEIWGPTDAQKRYEGRKDLGNTEPGDGKRFMGRTGFQLTGRSNYERFTKWVWGNISKDAPDFTKEPEKVNTDPWEGLVPIWFWSVGNRTGKSLNRYADENNIEQITKVINGGLNGYTDRVDYYIRSSLVLLGYSVGRTPTELESAIRKFQGDQNIEVDGDAGPQTRAKMHEAMAWKSRRKIENDPSTVVKSAPVTDKVEVPVAPGAVEKPGRDLTAIAIAGGTAVASSPIAKPALDTFGNSSELIQFTLIAVAVGALVYVFVIRQWLASRSKEIRENINEKQAMGLPITSGRSEVSGSNVA